MFQVLLTNLTRNTVQKQQQDGQNMTAFAHFTDLTKYCQHSFFGLCFSERKL